MPPLATHAEAGAKGGRGNKASDNVTSFRGDNSTSARGHSASYIVARLKRDHPEIAEALARGEFPSARAAAIEAGLHKKLSALDQIRRLLPNLTLEERAMLVRNPMQE